MIMNISYRSTNTTVKRIKNNPKEIKKKDEYSVSLLHERNARKSQKRRVCSCISIMVV